MRYYKEVSLRYGIAIILGIFPNVLYNVLAPVTLYLSYLGLKLFYSPELFSNALKIDHYTLNFVPACVAVSAYLLLAFLILTTAHISWKQRAKMFVLGSILILAMNIVRIVLLVTILIAYGKNYFQNIHLIFWHMVASLYVVVVWIFLIKKYKINAVPVVTDFKLLKKWLR